MIEGSIVKVRRSNGEIEGGWTIRGFSQTGDAIVVKFEGNQIIGKHIPRERLLELNKPVEEPSIDRATSFEELFAFLDNFGVWKGSNEDFTIPRLKQLINAARTPNSGVQSNHIPRHGGLRLKVIELLEIEQRQRSRR